MIEPPASLVSSVTARIRESMKLDVRGPSSYRVTCRAMSTPVNIAFVTPSLAVARDLAWAAVDWLGRFEARYSRFLPESIVGQRRSAEPKHGGTAENIAPAQPPAERAPR